MKKMFFIFLLPSLIFGIDFKNVLTFSADFKQTISSENEKKAVYEGSVIAKRPKLIKWTYKKPVKKYLYIIANEVIMVEPELEQAMFKTINDDINFLQILKKAKKISKEKYEAFYQNKKYTVLLKNDNIYKIIYKDSLDNDVVIEFFNQKINYKINNKEFKVNIPKDYDVIFEK